MVLTKTLLVDNTEGSCQIMFQLSIPRNKNADVKLAEYMYVVGAGLPRTGTLSLRNALEILGFGPCHHMAELHAKPDRSVEFARALDGDDVDFHELMKGYGSTLDLPTTIFYKEIYRAYPKAKIVLTVRDNGDKWYNSFKAVEPTFADDSYFFAVYPIRFLRLQCIVLRKIYQRWKKEHGGIGPWVHDQHNARVIRENAKHDVLVFNVKEGWEPLCKFLGVPVPPRVPFPNVNDVNELTRRIMLRKFLGSCIWVFVCIVLVVFGYFLILFGM